MAEIKSDRELLHGEFLAANGVARVKKRWHDISLIVNEVPGATVKRDGEEWKAVRTLHGIYFCIYISIVLYFFFFAGLGCTKR